MHQPRPEGVIRILVLSRRVSRHRQTRSHVAYRQIDLPLSLDRRQTDSRCLQQPRARHQTDPLPALQQAPLPASRPALRLPVVRLPALRRRALRPARPQAAHQTGHRLRGPLPAGYQTDRHWQALPPVGHQMDRPHPVLEVWPAALQQELARPVPWRGPRRLAPGQCSSPESRAAREQGR
jgi:hypothetical protein